MRQIIAMGGGGFALEPDNSVMDQYILQQAASEEPKICYLPTASGDSESKIQQFYNAFRRHECAPSHLSLFKPPTRDLEDFIMDQDIIYVGGGNTRNLLVLWKEWKLDLYLRRAWENHTVLAGSSAGANCWFEQAATVPIPGQLTSIHGLGLLHGSFCPHYNEAIRRPGYHRLLEDNLIGNGMGVDNGAALHYHDDQLFCIVSSRSDARAYEVDIVGGKISETEIKPLYLGSQES